jgi:hypothetical protein
MKRVCKQCGNVIRSNAKRTIFLWLRADGSEDWLCGPKCLQAYNEGEDLEAA